MELRNRLGIHLSKDKATVVCLGSQPKGPKVLGCFAVSVAAQDEQAMQRLAGLIVQGCDERGLKFSEVSLALDCSMFMQHSVPSEFSDPKKVAATVRFDAEESLATDISDMAIAFRIASADQTGSKLIVFTVQRKVLSDILACLQTSNIDPVTIEPDVICLSRYICRNTSPTDAAKRNTLFGVLSRGRGYLVGLSKSQQVAFVRTFLIGPAQNREDLLVRDTLITGASVQADSRMERLRVFDSTDSVRPEQLGEKLGVEVERLDLAGFAGAEPQVLAQCPDPVDFAIACGSALAHQEKAETVNFRSDFMPFQGKKLRLQKAVKFLCAAVAVLLLAAGIHLQMQLLKVNGNRNALRRKFEPDYLAVMLDEKKMPSFKDAVKKLSSVYRRIENEKGVITDKEAISAKLAMALEAFNSCAAATDLNIDSISITAGNIIVVGDTSSRRNTLRLFEAIDKGGLKILQQRLYPKDDRDNFSVTVVPAK